MKKKKRRIHFLGEDILNSVNLKKKEKKKKMMIIIKKENEVLNFFQSHM